MKKLVALIICYLLLSSHDMFLKMRTYHLRPYSPAVLDLYNGTFDRSDNIISRDRMIDVSMVGSGVRTSIDTSAWVDVDKTTVLNFSTGDQGTWMVGVSTAPRNIELAADAFNDYLEHDGVIDMLTWRKEHNTLDQDAIEKYSKHVKTIFQVGDKRSDDWSKELGYPIEFIPLSNPYETEVGGKLSFKLLRAGAPLADQLVYVPTNNHNHSHDDGHHHDEEDHHHHEATQLRTDDQGIVEVPITHAGVWFVRTIHMELVDEPGLTHESNWATITFEVGQSEDAAPGTHVHSDGSVHEDHHHHGLPSYAYVLGGILLLAGIYFGARRKSKPSN